MREDGVGRWRADGDGLARCGIALAGATLVLACAGAVAAPRSSKETTREPAPAGGASPRPSASAEPSSAQTPTAPAAPTPPAAATGLPAPNAACRPASGAAIPVPVGCEVGAPIRPGELLRWPRACRLLVEAKSIDRHTIELRDLRTGQRRAQISLPASPAAGEAPRVGALVAGALPLYVHAAGVTAIDIAGRKAEAVHEAEHGLLGFARLGDWLAIVEAVPPDSALPQGGVQWTVLDSEAGRLLGEARIAGRGLLGLGVAKAPVAGKIIVWLRMTGRKGEADLVATIDAAGVGEGEAVPILRPVPGTAPSASPLIVGETAARAAGRCAVVDGYEPLVLERPFVRVSATAQRVPASGLAMVEGDCLVTTPPSEDATWALRMRDGRPELARFTCGPVAKVGAAPTAGAPAQAM